MINRFLKFTKIEHTAFSLPLLFTGAWLGGQGHWPRLSTILLIILAATGARIFGMAFNRIFDRHIDAHNPRTCMRELPSGKMKTRTAFIIALCGFAVYMGACALLGRWCMWLSPVPLIPLLGYSLLKRYTALCHFGIGICLALAPLGAYVAAAGNAQFTSAIVLFSGFVFFWLSGSDIIYALMDLDSDRKNGIYSLPVKLGAKRAQIVAGIVHILALSCLAGILAAGNAGLAARIGFLITLALFTMLYLPFIPVARRFFPMATLAGAAGALTPLLV
ncbi:MAG: 4-hydroxybenzoate octaprenyltransferase [Desulfobacteraceae bacterium]|nr:4-hydroxybenzoate octaprenyltransferase [Desulfobacteraceae bacterium]